MSAAGVDIAAEIEAIRQLKARYCRFLDTKDVESWRRLFADDVRVRVDLTPATAGAAAQPGPAWNSADEFVAAVMASLENAATVHHCHTSEIALTSGTAASGIWAMEDRIVYPGGRELRGTGFYHETYAKQDGDWRIKTQHLTRTLVQTLGDWSSVTSAP
jgi:hypothetical protein